MNALDDKIGNRIGATAEASTRKERVNLHLSGIQTGRCCSVGLIHRLELIARPNLAAIVRKPYDAVEWLRFAHA